MLGGRGAGGVVAFLKVTCFFIAAINFSRAIDSFDDVVGDEV